MATQVEHIKWVPGTNFMVDGFRFQNERCRHYFLTHSHGDHTTGLSKSFSSGKIYCTPITATLLLEESRIPEHRVQSVDLDEPFELEGCRVTAICANHCPGACMFLFQLQKPDSSSTGFQAHTTILHTGDFRYHDGMPLCRSLKHVTIDTLMLDTTYSTPKWAFPDQDTAVSSAVAIIQKAREDNHSTVFAFNAYHIGKERCYFKAAQLCHFSVWVSNSRFRTLNRLQLPHEWMSLITKDKQKADIIVSDQGVRPEQLQALRCELGRAVVGFQCTGWGYQKVGIRKRAQDGTLCYSIPYSEHSSWPELRRCVKAFAPKRLIPTVNVGSKAKFEGMVAKFADAMDLRRSKSHIDRFCTAARRSADDATLESPKKTFEADWPAARKDDRASDSPHKIQQAVGPANCADDLTPDSAFKTCEADVPAACTVSRGCLDGNSPDKGSETTIALPCQPSNSSAGCSSGLKRDSCMPLPFPTASKLQKMGCDMCQGTDLDADSVWYDSPDEFDVCEVFDLNCN